MGAHVAIASPGASVWDLLLPHSGSAGHRVAKCVEELLGRAEKARAHKDQDCNNIDLKSSEQH